MAEIEEGGVAIYTRQYDKAEIPVYVLSPRIWNTKSGRIVPMRFVERLDLPRSASGRARKLIVPEWCLQAAQAVMKEQT